MASKIQGSLIELSDLNGELTIMDFSRILHVRKEKDPSNEEYCVAQFSFDAQPISDKMDEILDLLPESLFVNSGGTFLSLTDANGEPCIVNFERGSFQSIKNVDKGTAKTLIQHNPKNFMYVQESVEKISRMLPDKFFLPAN